MANSTTIEWTDLTWNPVHGCSIVSTECKHCYAMTLSLRYGQTTKPWTPANAAENVILKPHKLREPLSLGKDWQGLGAAASAAGKTDGKLVFVNSMSDLFHDQVPDEFIARVFATMALAPQHTFQILTKRPDRMAELLSHPEFENVFRRATGEVGHALPLANVWLGTSCGLRHFMGRLDDLRETPAAVRFVSAEPLLGPLVDWMFCSTCSQEGANRLCEECGGAGYWPLQGASLDLSDIDWLIAGGESGPGHRPMQEQWACDLRDLAELYGTAFFFKQWGGPRPGGQALLDGREHRAFPSAVTA